MKRLAVLFLSLWSAAVCGADLLPPEKAFGATAQRIDANTVALRYVIAPGYYLYKEKFSFATNTKNADSTKRLKPVLPPGKMKQDPYFGRVEIYRDTLTIRLPVQEAGEDQMIEATSQGCADVGVCYPPVTQYLRPKRP
ncbi:MAG TPA: protein-disulfide reductase DsbD N-terminal domain-containing protein [Burkholderiales bacterium]|nr:protein-disulfide reductase DsbD N-terminal domain-containing protein [Burkholderiales bacterium]